MAVNESALVVGCGIFGLTAALELDARGIAVTMLDAGTVPHPLASSTDISKVVRIEYGADELYTRMAEDARAGWLDWNSRLFAVPLYHETGAVFMSQDVMRPGGYEYENFHMLGERGHEPERLDSAAIRQRFPAWNSDRYVDGYFNPRAGFVESGKVVTALAAVARDRGIRILEEHPVAAIDVSDRGALMAHLASGGMHGADHIVVAAGAWTPTLLPELATVLRSTGQPVFHVKPADPRQFMPPHFVVFGADSSRTGWYGFPTHPDTGVVKIANHGPGAPVDPVNDPRQVSAAQCDALREFLAETFPALADAPVVYTRCCLYCDTPDEHFLIARHPAVPGLTIAAGDSGHAFKFAPVLGKLIADAVTGRPSVAGDRFAWRDFTPGAAGQEASRAR
ncbi:MAG: FAD-dependent oxidoreductase [Chloroflexota bacterium]|nr:FAD-dependent oxidoreductase [Chloroflexota bacterium]